MKYLKKVKYRQSKYWGNQDRWNTRTNERNAAQVELKRALTAPVRCLKKHIVTSLSLPVKASSQATTAGTVGHFVALLPARSFPANAALLRA